MSLPHRLGRDRGEWRSTSFTLHAAARWLRDVHPSTRVQPVDRTQQLDRGTRPCSGHVDALATVLHIVPGLDGPDHQPQGEEQHHC